MKKLIYLTSLICLTLHSCTGQSTESAKNNSIDKHREQILPEEEMRVTTDKAIMLIQERNYDALKDLFADDIAKNIPDQQIIQLVDHLNMLFINEGVPSDRKNVLHALNATVTDRDTVFINSIMYKFEPVSDGTNSSQQVLTFKFLKKYGTEKLYGVNFNTNPLSTGNDKPTVNQLENFDFNTSEIVQFRIYYDEGEVKKTKFKNEVGLFAIQGEAVILKESGVLPIIQAIFHDLEKSKFEKVYTFNSSLNRDKDAQFIQADFLLKNKPYSLFIYLPLKSEGEFKDKIVIRQQEYANLGYQFILNQKDYPELVSEFTKIAKLDLNDYYLDKP